MFTVSSMAEPNEDIEYEVPDFAVPDVEPTVDVDQPNKSTLKKVLREIKLDIIELDGLKGINLPANATPDEKIAAFDQMLINKGVALYLQKYEQMIDNKVKELR